MFNQDGVINLINPTEWARGNATENGTTVVFYLTTQTGYDLLEWTHLVRLLYYHTGSINMKYKGRFIESQL